jgi:hypothetical protein
MPSPSRALEAVPLLYRRAAAFAIIYPLPPHFKEK